MVATVSINLQAAQIAEIVKVVNAVALEDGRQTPAYAATITPALDATAQQTIVPAALTGNVTIGAPTNPKLGMRLLFIFTQDGTGSRTITWNAVFKASANGAGAANTKGATEFFYDGTNWVQIGGALAFA